MCASRTGLMYSTGPWLLAVGPTTAVLRGKESRKVESTHATVTYALKNEAKESCGANLNRFHL